VPSQKGNRGAELEGRQGCLVRREIGTPSQNGDRGAESEGERVSWSEEKYGAWSAGREGCLGIL